MGQLISYDIMINFIGFLLGVIVTWSFNLAKRIYERRVPKGFWSMGRTGANIVYGVWDVNRNGEPEAMVNLAVVYAIGEALSYLREITDVSIYTCNDPVAKDSNLFLVGGPLANSLTAEFAQRFTPYFYFYDLDPSNREICNQSKTVRFVSKFDAQGNLVYDVGWFIRAPNPLNYESIVVIAAGNYGAGTQAVIRFLTSTRSLRQLKVGKNDRAEGVVGATIENGRIISFELLSFRKTRS